MFGEVRIRAGNRKISQIFPDVVPVLRMSHHSATSHLQSGCLKFGIPGLKIQQNSSLKYLSFFLFLYFLVQTYIFSDSLWKMFFFSKLVCTFFAIFEVLHTNSIIFAALGKYPSRFLYLPRAAMLRYSLCI